MERLLLGVDALAFLEKEGIEGARKLTGQG